MWAAERKTASGSCKIGKGFMMTRLLWRGRRDWDGRSGHVKTDLMDLRVNLLGERVGCGCVM